MDGLDRRHLQEQHIEPQSQEQRQGAERHKRDRIQRHGQGRDDGKRDRNGSKGIRQLIKGPLTAKESGGRLPPACLTSGEPAKAVQTSGLRDWSIAALCRVRGNANSGLAG